MESREENWKDDIASVIENKRRIYNRNIRFHNSDNFVICVVNALRPFYVAHFEFQLGIISLCLLHSRRNLQLQYVVDADLF